MADHYTQLGLKADATQEEIGQVILHLRRELSKYAPGIDFTDGDIARLFPEKWSALRVLSDPIQRETYDLVLQSGQEGDPVQEESIAALQPQTRMSAFFSYLAFIGLMSVAVLFLLLLAGYML